MEKEEILVAYAMFCFLWRHETGNETGCSAAVAKFKSLFPDLSNKYGTKGVWFVDCG